LIEALGQVVAIGIFAIKANGLAFLYRYFRAGTNGDLHFAAKRGNLKVTFFGINPEMCRLGRLQSVAAKLQLEVVGAAVANVEVSGSLLQFHYGVTATACVETQIGESYDGVRCEPNGTSIFEFDFGLAVARPQLRLVRHRHVQIRRAEPVSIRLVNLHIAVDVAESDDAGVRIGHCRH
jgi:hypothetical protein